MKNYFSYSFYFTASVVLILTVVALAVPTQVFGFKLKQANIYSEIIGDEQIRETFGLEGSPFVYQKQIVDAYNSSNDFMDMLIDSVVASLKAIKELDRRPAPTTPKGVIALHDFSDNGYHLEPFFKKLASSGSRNVRIAFLGDSFIEGDIMTADMRELFQNSYRGGGVGFMPITSQVAKFRGSIVHNFSPNWVDHTIIKNQAASKFMMSGHSFTLRSDEGWVEYQGNTYRKHLNTFDKATLMFVNRGNTTIRVIVNGGEPQEFTPESSDELQWITIQDSIYKIRFEVSGMEGFTAYGTLLDDRSGVSVDNYSLRGNSGIGMTAVNLELCNQMSRVAPYDLIVLEYGLNVVEADVTSYGGYRNHMINVVNHLKSCYPGTPIIIMGVSDRSTMVNGDFVTMDGVKAMDAAQKDAARRCGVAYWSTLDAMRSLGGMPKFVEVGWAAKDYTHIGSGGGRKIGQKFFEAIVANK